MAQPPPRPGPPGAPAPGGPTRTSAPPGMGPPRPGPPGPLGPGGQPSPPARYSGPPGETGPQYAGPPIHQYGNLQSSQMPPEGDGDVTKKDKKKRKKKKKIESDTESDSDDSCCGCECQSGQPATQIFISQGGPQQQYQHPGQDMYGDAMDDCPDCLTWDQWCQQSCTTNSPQMRPPCVPVCLSPCSPAKTKRHKTKKPHLKASSSSILCCPKKPQKSSNKNCCQPMMFCTPTQVTSSSSQKKKTSRGCCCDGSSGSKNGKGTLEEMMPATQQFLMFLQAYGLAATLIKDRCSRDTSCPPAKNAASQPKTGFQCMPVMYLPCSPCPQDPPPAPERTPECPPCPIPTSCQMPFITFPMCSPTSTSQPPSKHNCPPCPPCPDPEKESKKSSTY